MANKIRDLSELRAGMLTAMFIIRTDRNGRKIWLCRCDCGSEVERASSIFCDAMKNNKVSHCGCSPSLKTHGLSQSNKKLYWVWAAMIQRCENQSCKDFSGYGGRGINICNEWRFDFGSFHKWAILSGYQEGLTIERSDVNLGYCPENCCWVVNNRQSLNCRRSAIFTWNGKTQHLSDWARELDINYKTLRGRIFDYDWDLNRAFTERPVAGGSNA